MENSFQNYISTFNSLNDIDKKDEIIKNLKELFDYLKTINIFETGINALRENDNDNEEYLFYFALFKYINNSFLTSSLT